MTRICKHCGNKYAGWRCPCRRRGKRGGRPRSIVSTGCGTRRWNINNARARMLGGWNDLGASPQAGITESASGVGDADET